MMGMGVVLRSIHLLVFHSLIIYHRLLYMLRCFCIYASLHHIAFCNFSCNEFLSIFSQITLTIGGEQLPGWPAGSTTASVRDIWAHKGTIRK